MLKVLLPRSLGNQYKDNVVVLHFGLFVCYEKLFDYEPTHHGAKSGLLGNILSMVC